jgi:hypothetical protein
MFASIDPVEGTRHESNCQIVTRKKNCQIVFRSPENLNSSGTQTASGVVSKMK